MAESLRCRCSTHSCPGDHVNETCTTEGQCYKKVEPGDDDSYELITYGCLPPAEKTRMQCNTPDHVHKKQLSMECCRNGDMCNTFLQPTLPTTPSPATGRGLSELLYILCMRVSFFAIVWVFILQNSWVHDYFGLSIITEFGLKRVLLINSMQGLSYST